MIELIDNAINMAAAAICTVVAFIYMVRTNKRAWVLLTLSSGVFFLGDLYWQLYLLFYGETPPYSYISDYSWYAASLLMFILLTEIRAMHGKWYCYRILWMIPVFTVGMAIFFLQWGDPLGNLVTVGIRTSLLWNAFGGLLASRTVEEEKPNRMFYALSAVYCLSEYSTELSSCFWMGDTIRNPYFWSDTVMSAVLLLLPIGLRKAVDR